MLFNGCKNLIYVDKLSEWQAPNLKKMEYLFDRCEKIEDIYLGTFNTEHVKSMRGLFNGCSSLIRIKTKKIWETSNLEDISLMFQGCSSLEKGDFISYLSNTSRVKNMSGLFSKCSKLKKSIPKLVTNNVEYMVGLFNECTALDRIDVSSWNMSNIKDISFMFYKCTSLKSLSGIDNWHFNHEFKYESTFDQCPNIKEDEFNNKLKTKNEQLFNKKIEN
jgi:surface protein